jgi:hypothetical protein
MRHRGFELLECPVHGDPFYGQAVALAIRLLHRGMRRIQGGKAIACDRAGYVVIPTWNVA